MKSSGVRQSMHRCKRGMALLMTTELIVGCGISGSSFISEAEPGDALKDKYTGFEGVKINWKYGSAEDASSYGNYTKKHANVANATETIEVDLSKIQNDNGKLSVTEYEGKKAIFSEKSAEYIEFNVNVPKTGMYQLEVDYYLEPGESDEGKRILYFDGRTPFKECSDITLYRFFRDASEPVINSVGDETRPG